MAEDLKPGAERENAQYRLSFRKPAFHEWIGMAIWLGVTAFCVQFALASAEELEPQASVLGWLLVVILLIAGLAFWGAKFHGHNRQQD